MGKLNMELYQTLYIGDPDELAFMAGMRDYQVAMMQQIFGVQVEKVGPRDWSPRTGRCLCPKHQA